MPLLGMENVGMKENLSWSELSLRFLKYQREDQAGCQNINLLPTRGT
jgi:hypothetical protein